MDQLQDGIPKIVLILFPLYIAITAYTAKVKLKFSKSEKEVWSWARVYANASITLLAVISGIYGLFIEFTSEEPITREALFRILLYLFVLLVIFINTAFLQILKLLDQMADLNIKHLMAFESSNKISSEQLEMIKDLYRKFYGKED